MCHERIHSMPCWQNEYPRCDTVFVETNADVPGMQGMVIGHVLLFISFLYQGACHDCAFINWLVIHGDSPDPETGLWVVKPEYMGNRRTVALIPMDCIARGAHLLPVYSAATPLPATFHFACSLDVFQAFFVNRFVDHHAHEFVY